MYGEYGINQPAAHYNMTAAFEAHEQCLPNLIPFGYDAYNCQLYVEMLEIPGRIVYFPTENVDSVQARPTIYLVATSISEFLLLSSKMADEFVDDENGRQL